jgi:hypothetical protein
VPIRRLVRSLCCQFVCVSSVAITARHWIEARGRGRDCTIMMRIILLALLHIVLKMRIVLAHSSTFSCATSLRFPRIYECFAQQGYCLRQGLARMGCSAVGRTGITTEARPRRFGRVRRSCTVSPCLRLLQKVTPLLPMSFPRIPRCVSRAGVLLLGCFFVYENVFK